MADSAHKQEASLTLTPESQEMRFSVTSALPPPEVLAGYEKIMPGSAGRYFDLFEIQMTKRHDAENMLARRTFGLQIAAMALGFFVNVGTMGAAVWLASLGMNGPSIAAIVASILMNLTFFSQFANAKTPKK